MDLPTLSEPAPLIMLESISKRFGALWANRDISFDVLEGEIHAVVGENGAGKSTLMKILFGHFKPDAGRLIVRGQPVTFRSPREAMREGFGMVHQQLLIFPQLSAYENIVVGSEPKGWGWERRSKARRKVLDLCRLFGFDIPLDGPAGELPFAHRQQIELLRILYRGARVLILDEPTSLLGPPEVERLVELLKGLKAAGHTVLFVSHRLQEVFALADRVSVLRQGRYRGTLCNSQTSVEEVTRLIMAGAESSPHEDGPFEIGAGTLAAKTPPSPPVPMIQLQRVTAPPSGHEPGLEDFSLTVHEGEILGIGGVVGNGQRTLSHVLVGMQQVERGLLFFETKEITRSSIAERRNKGICWLPANPFEEGLLSTRPIWENFLLGRQRRPYFSAKGWLFKNEVRRQAREQLNANEVAHPDINESIAALSGGNQQKMILARELSNSPRFAVLEQPARGLDIRAQDRLRRRILAMNANGVTFLVLSYDLEELLSIADRIGILFRGRLMGIVERENAARGVLGQWMLGLEG